VNLKAPCIVKRGRESSSPQPDSRSAFIPNYLQRNAPQTCAQWLESENIFLNWPSDDPRIGLVASRTILVRTNVAAGGRAFAIFTYFANDHLNSNGWLLPASGGTRKMKVRYEMGAPRAFRALLDPACVRSNFSVRAAQADGD